MSDTQPPFLTYPGGFDEVVARLDGRRDPLGFAEGEALPALDADLVQMKSKLLEIPENPPRKKDRSEHLRKWLELAEDFEGQPELLHLHGLLIAHLRKSDQPSHTMELFVRLWTEEHEWLIAHLDPRWLVSAVTTFGDHGQTEVQRRVGSAMTVLFGTMKLYESERLYSGVHPEAPFKLKRHVSRQLPLNMDRYALVTGGLDVNMLGRLWVDAAPDPVFAPLAHHLLELVNRDPGTVFRRLKTLSGRMLRQRNAKAAAKSEAQEKAPATWSVVSTIKADANTVRRFAEHHLALGAQTVTVYLDAPLDQDVTLPGLTLVTCDEAYWALHKYGRPEKHQNRQAYNATRAYRDAKTDWICHIDADEFLHSEEPIADVLKQTSSEFDALIMPPAEEIATDGSEDLLFRRMYLDAGCEKSVLDKLYPTFSRYIRSGFISHTIGKTFARTGLKGARMGVHLLKVDGVEIKNSERSKAITVLHRHAPNWESFRADLDFRMTQGSYRTRGIQNMGLADIIDVLVEDKGEAGIRLLFDEVCTADTEKRELMDAHGLLLRARLLTLPEAANV